MYNERSDLFKKPPLPLPVRSYMFFNIFPFPLSTLTSLNYEMSMDWGQIALK